MQRIGVMGASFNPPTRGHVSVILQAYNDFDDILLVPSLLHAFQKNLSPIEHRLRMLHLMVENELSAREKQRVTIFNIEPTLLSANPNATSIYTFDVLTAIEHFYQKQNVPCEIRFIVGPDLAAPAMWHKFYRYQEIEQRWPLYVVKEKLPIHSTMVRDIVSKISPSNAIQKMQLSELVGDSIADYILAHHLYQDSDLQHE